MKKELELLKEFNKKFKIDIPENPELINEEKCLFRNKILKKNVELWKKKSQSLFFFQSSTIF